MSRGWGVLLFGTGEYLIFTIKNFVQNYLTSCRLSQGLEFQEIRK